MNNTNLIFSINIYNKKKKTWKSSLSLDQKLLFTRFGWNNLNTNFTIEARNIQFPKGSFLVFGCSKWVKKNIIKPNPMWLKAMMQISPSWCLKHIYNFLPSLAYKFVYFVIASCCISPFVLCILKNIYLEWEAVIGLDD